MSEEHKENNKDPDIVMRSLTGSDETVTVNFGITVGSLYQETSISLQGGLSHRRAQKLGDIEKQARAELRHRLGDLVEALRKDSE